jgi:hypothetical protein
MIVTSNLIQTPKVVTIDQNRWSRSVKFTGHDLLEWVVTVDQNTQFLEESSAERIIREYLIPWFAPILRRVRTVAAGGVDAVEPLFADFHRLFLFIHLQPAYTGRAWVRVDGDDAGRKVIKSLRDRFSSFGADAFSCWSEKQFEHFYPSTFSGDVTQALSLSDKQDRRTAKLELLDKVVKWIDEDQDRARQAFAESAHPVIEDLQAIGRSLDTISPPLP